MMPICGYKTLFGRCRNTAEHSIGKIALLGEYDGGGRQWEQTHYLCYKHQIELLKTLGFRIRDEG